MVNLKFEHNLADMVGVLNSLKTGIEQKACVRAMNRTMDMARTEASKNLRENYSFKAAQVKATMKVFRASPNRLEATLQSRGKRTRLIDMEARQTREGVTVKVGKSRKLIKHAFIATMKSGHRGVFIRLTKKNLPIKELYTIGIPEAFGSRVVMQAIDNKVRTVFGPRFEHELKYLMQTGR